MVPVVVGSDQLIGHLLLLRRQAGIERLEHSKKTGVITEVYAVRIGGAAWGLLA